MVDQSAPLDAVFQALADPTRRSMLARLAGAEHSVGELAAPFAMTLAAASKHIRALERAGLVTRTVIGRTHRVRLEPAPLQRADAWLRRYEAFWTQRLDRLEELLEAGQPTPSTPDVPDGTRSPR